MTKLKSALLILIGFIICTLKCEIIEGAAEEKIEDVKITSVVDTIGAEESPENIMQTNVTIITSPGDTTGAGEQPDSIMQQKNTIETAAVVDTMGAGEQSDGIIQPKVTMITPAVDTTSTGEPPDNIMQSETSIMISPVDTTGDGEQPDGIIQPKVTIITPSVEPTDVGGQADNIKQKDNVEKTEVTKKQEIQVNDTGPSKIKVEDAINILHKTKKIYALESIALIKKLEWLRTVSNITELEIEHKFDPKSFDYLSDTETSLNSSSIARRQGLEEDPDFMLLKKSILKERGKSIKFKHFPRL